MSIDPFVLITGLAALFAALNQFRLIRENKRKVLAEGSRDLGQREDWISQAAERLVIQVQGDNEQLRKRVKQLEEREQKMERRIDLLEDTLREHGVEIPAPE